MEETETIYARDRKEWRSWLEKNSKSKKDIWLIYYKKYTGKQSVSYIDAVEEAICFGWIDGQIKKIDEEIYMQRYSPRTHKSLWSEINVERAERMIKHGIMTETGLKAFHEGTKTNKRVPSSKNFSMPAYLTEALEKNKKALDNFQNFSPSAKLAYVYWIGTAKTEETRQKRINSAIEQLAKNKRFGE